MKSDVRLVRGIEVERNLKAALEWLEWYEKSAELEGDHWGGARYRAGILRQRLATSNEDLALAQRHFEKAAELGHLRAGLEVAKCLIQSRDGYQFSKYRYNPSLEGENAEYDAGFAKGIDLLERVANQSNSDIENRIEALSILAELYEDGRIRCRSQFNSVGDQERLECALEYYRKLLQLDVNADDHARDDYRNSIAKIQVMLDVLPNLENVEDQK